MKNAYRAVRDKHTSRKMSKGQEHMTQRSIENKFPISLWKKFFLSNNQIDEIEIGSLPAEAANFRVLLAHVVGESVIYTLGTCTSCDLLENSLQSL